MKKIVLALFIICIFTYKVIAAPAISIGTVGEGVFTLSGVGFGTKTTASPLKWETFESGTEGSLLSTGGYWSHKSVNTASFYAEPRGTSSLAARQRQIGDETENWFYRNNVLSNSDDKGLIIFWCKTVVAAWDITDTWQQKMWAVIYDGSNYLGDSNAPALYAAPQYNTNSIYDYATLVYNDAFQSQETMNGNDLYNTTGYWQMTAVEWRRSSIDGNDAVMYRYLSDPVGTLAINKIAKTGFNTRTTAVNRNLLSFQFGLMNTNSGEQADVTMYYDDIYIDNSWARVEIGDEPIYANCRHREIQPAATWSDTGITGTLNIGSFSPTATVYFFVVDEDGVASAGKEVALGGTPTYNPPTITAPSDFNTTASSVEIEGPYTIDPDLTVSTVTWTLGENSGFCVALLGTYTGTVTGLANGANTVTIEIVASNSGSYTDTVIITKIPTSVIRGAAVLKGAVIHQ